MNATNAQVRPDGRRARGRESRRRIAEAMMAILREGEMFPSAAAVAERAGVGLRTVYRHFDDMDALYREIAEAAEAAVAPVMAAPFRSQDWREQLLEAVDKRADVFEEIAPFKIASNVRRFQSAFLRADYDRFLTLERDGLARVLPASIRRDAADALRAVLSFQFWRSLRLDERLSAERTKAAMRIAVLGVLRELDEAGERETR